MKIRIAILMAVLALIISCSKKRIPVQPDSILPAHTATVTITNTLASTPIFSTTRTITATSTINTYTITSTRTVTRTATINTPTLTFTETPDVTSTDTPTVTATATITNTPKPGEHWVRLSQSGYCMFEGVDFMGDIWNICHDGTAYTITNAVWTYKHGSFYGGENRYYHATTVYDNKIWSTGGYFYDYDSNQRFTADVLYTTGTGSWVSVTRSAEFGKMADHTCVDFNAKMWLVGGNTGVYSYNVNSFVFSSTDGITWANEGQQLFSARYGHSCTVYDGKMWVIGGFYGGTPSGYKDDVWNSSDGVTWNLVTGTAQIGVRMYHTCIVHDNKMWVIGGDHGATIYHDVWNSTDGITWNLVTDTPEFGNRTLHSSLEFNGKMWVLGGYGGVYDIWYSY